MPEMRRQDALKERIGQAQPSIMPRTAQISLDHERRLAGL